MVMGTTLHNMEDTLHNMGLTGILITLLLEVIHLPVILHLVVIPNMVILPLVVIPNMVTLLPATRQLAIPHQAIPVHQLHIIQGMEDLAWEPY